MLLLVDAGAQVALNIPQEMIVGGVCTFVFGIITYLGRRSARKDEEETKKLKEDVASLLERQGEHHTDIAVLYERIGKRRATDNTDDDNNEGPRARRSSA